MFVKKTTTVLFFSPSYYPTTNGGMQNGSSVGKFTHCMHVFARFAPICMLSLCLLTKFLHRSSVGSLLRVRCWLGCDVSVDAFFHLFFRDEWLFPRKALKKRETMDITTFKLVGRWSHSKDEREREREDYCKRLPPWKGRKKRFVLERIRFRVYFFLVGLVWRWFVGPRTEMKPQKKGEEENLSSRSSRAKSASFRPAINLATAAQVSQKQQQQQQKQQQQQQQKQQQVLTLLLPAHFSREGGGGGRTRIISCNSMSFQASFKGNCCAHSKVARWRPSTATKRDKSLTFSSEVA